MNEIIIKAENLGKKYIIGQQAQNGGYVALRDVWMQNARSLWFKSRDILKGKINIKGETPEDFWALKDVSFELHRGEAGAYHNWSQRCREKHPAKSSLQDH